MPNHHNWKIEITCDKCQGSMMQSSMQQWTYFCVNRGCDNETLTLKLKVMVVE